MTRTNYTQTMAIDVAYDYLVDALDSHEEAVQMIMDLMGYDRSEAIKAFYVCQEYLVRTEGLPYQPAQKPKGVLH